MNEILLEYYQGKTKELIKCENYLKEIIKDAKRDASTGILGKNILTKSNPWNIKLEKELRDFFKVKSVDIYWKDGAVNAMTYKPSAIMISMDKSSYATTGLHNQKISIMVYTDCITKANVNEQELLALILHEIGHNFYCCPIMFGFNVFAVVVSSPIALIIYMLRSLINKATLTIIDLVKKELPIIYNSISGFNSTMNDLGNFIKPLMYFTVMGNRVRQYILDPLSIINLFTGYGDERGADSFATTYGYGPELGSALRKLTIVENSIYGKSISNGGTITSIMTDISELSCEIIAMMTLDPHPSHNQRASTMLTKLKKDLRTNDYPDGVKKDLEKEIVRMEKIYKTIATNSTSSNVQVRQNWYSVIDGITGGNSDFRELFKFYYDSYLF